MPPGPTPIPFIGNKLDLPKSKPWIKFQEWSKIYGPIYTIWIGRRPTVIISDPNIAVDLLEKRSNKYSSRPRFVAMGEIHWDMAPMLVQPYGKSWSVRRKLLHHAMTPAALRLYKPVQEAEAARLSNHLLQDPVHWERYIDRFTASIVFSISYGHRIDSLNAKIVRQRLDFMQYAAELNVPGAYLVESFPILKYMPRALAPWKREMQDKGRVEAAENMELVEMVKRDIANGKEKGKEVPDSLCKLLLRIREKEGVALSDRDFAFVPSSLFGAGSDTTASTLCSGFLALITHPETLIAAHEEVDRVIGPDRTPTFADEAQLPYIRALCKEILRWRPVAVLGGTPHASTEDDVYEGWYIPAGTTILGNSWAINLNDQYYPNPHHFNPLRFLDDASAATYVNSNEKADLEKGKPHPAKSGHSSFGWGRRICPGMAMAENSLFAAVSKLVWAFDILPIQGRVYDVFDYTEGFNIRPRKFECVIRVRSEAHKRVVERENRAAEELLARYPCFEE
ncbi:hypothetical protein MMC19_003252 [Ptychographa xylographoides]|nr:hypothetical protein [Ptychographa xylographoides]